MDSILHRYRNLMVLVIVVGFQLVLVGYQVRGKEDMRLIRVWAVTAITPLARLLEAVRGGGAGFLNDYVFLVTARDENHRLKDELGRLKLENQQLRQDLGTADRAQGLLAFAARTPSKLTAARVIANSSGVNSRVVFIDRGTSSGVARGMAVITPDGIVGRVLLAYPAVSQVMLVTDSGFGAGAVSQKAHTSGIVRGQGNSILTVDRIPMEEKIEIGDRFYTSGDDRIFPRGLLIGEVKAVTAGRLYKEITLTPSGFQGGMEEVLIVMEGVHQQVPDVDPAKQPIKLLPPPDGESDGKDPTEGQQITDADKLKERYRRIGEAQGIGFGTPGKPPNFNLDPNAPPRPAATPAPMPIPSPKPTPAPAGAPIGTNQ